MTLNPANDAFRARLEADLPAGTIRTADARYLEEPRGRYFGQPGILAAPACTQDVARILNACNDARVGVVPFGGGTGLVGGQVDPDTPQPLILSLERMNTLRDVYPLENVMVAEAGAILADVQAAAEAHNRLFPLSLGSEGSARIGGNLSTNAGGVHVLRYGTARDLCLGLEVVLPSGEIWNGLSRLRKDNTGYDLRHLMIGAEGTLGVITAAALKLFARPASVGTAVMVVPSPAAALELLAIARDQVGEGVSAFELIHRQGLEFVSEKLPDVRQPMTPLPEWMVLMEFGLAADADGALETVFAQGLDAGLGQDGVIAQSTAQQSAFWHVREAIPIANKMIGSVASHDISLPLSAIAEFIEEARSRLLSMSDIRINCFGHLGDGNLHFNVFPGVGKQRSDYEDVRGQVSRTVHDLVHSYDGSFSAEHGVGRMKVDDLERYGDPTGLAAMRAIKQALDPNGIMNPGAVLRA
ncbi:FAD-binding oxidoreductase [Shimia sp.]|uniref:FAD-binding oxidoreductase n=1 Tax=Shimia sp. TaxID=1954381 RepID=UPI00329A5444